MKNQILILMMSIFECLILISDSFLDLQKKFFIVFQDFMDFYCFFMILWIFIGFSGFYEGGGLEDLFMWK